MIDGRLNDPEWNFAERITDFMQREPDNAQPASERTEVRMLYDSEALYFAFYLYDSEPDRIIARELRRDDSLRTDDTIAVVLDTLKPLEGLITHRVPLSDLAEGVERGPDDPFGGVLSLHRLGEHRLAVLVDFATRTIDPCSRILIVGFPEEFQAAGLVELLEGVANADKRLESLAFLDLRFELALDHRKLLLELF